MSGEQQDHFDREVVREREGLAFLGPCHDPAQQYANGAIDFWPRVEGVQLLAALFGFLQQMCALEQRFEFVSVGRHLQLPSRLGERRQASGLHCDSRVRQESSHWDLSLSCATRHRAAESVAGAMRLGASALGSKRMTQAA